MSLKVKQGWNVLLVVLVDQFAHNVLISSVRRKYFTGLKCFRCDLHGPFIGRYFNLYLKSYDKDCSRGWRLLHYPYLKSWFSCCQISLPFNPPLLCVHYNPELCTHVCRAVFSAACTARLHELQGRCKKSNRRGFQLEMELPVVYLDTGHIYAQRGSLVLPAHHSHCQVVNCVCAGSVCALWCARVDKTRP